MILQYISEKVYYFSIVYIIISYKVWFSLFRKKEITPISSEDLYSFISNYFEINELEMIFLI